MAGLSKTIVWIGTAAFGLGHGAGERADTHSLLDPAIACTAHVSIDTNASVHAHSQARGTVTAEGPFVVDAVAIHADPWGLALIYISTVTPIWSQDESWFADALEAAIFINAHPIQTHVGSCTFIMINTVFSICS